MMNHVSAGDTFIVTPVVRLVQAHPVLQLIVKLLIGAIAITAVYQSQLYALWLQYAVATVAAVLVAAYGFSRSSLSSSGQWQ